MREIELKAVVRDREEWRARAQRAGARVAFEGRMIDKRYDTPSLALAATDHVLRLRVYEGAEPAAHLDWKGPTLIENGFKVREEITTPVTSAEALGSMLEKLGYIVTREIERDVLVCELTGCTIRFERYPRMDDLLEIEGEPAAIERAIATLGMDRSEFTAERLFDFALRYEARTGQRAALSARELAGDYQYALDQA